MSLVHWLKSYGPGNFIRRTGNNIAVYIPSRMSRQDLSYLSDYRLVRTDNYKGSYVALLEKRCK